MATGVDLGEMTGEDGPNQSSTIFKVILGGDGIPSAGLTGDFPKSDRLDASLGKEALGGIEETLACRGLGGETEDGGGHWPQPSSRASVGRRRMEAVTR